MLDYLEIAFSCDCCNNSEDTSKTLRKLLWGKECVVKKMIMEKFDVLLRVRMYKENLDIHKIKNIVLIIVSFQISILKNKFLTV